MVQSVSFGNVTLRSRRSLGVWRSQSTDIFQQCIDPVLLLHKFYLLPHANEVCEGYVFTPVCQSFCSQGGVSAPVHAGIHTVPGRHPLGRHPPPPQADISPGQCMLGDTGHKRVVRILLECILVHNITPRHGFLKEHFS